MDYENFKESFTEALQEDLYGKGIEAKVFELGEKFVEREAVKDSVEKHFAQE